MAGFDSHSKCARCRDKGLGDDPCVLKKECFICKWFTPEQVLQLATPTYKDRKEKKTTSSTPTLVDPAHVSVLGKVEKVKAVQSTTKKTKRSESASKKKSSSRFSRLEVMLLAKTFTVPFYCVNISYLVDRCICPAHSRSRQTLEKNASSWALARTGSVLFTRQVAV